jgi:hypothetical protein
MTNECRGETGSNALECSGAIIFESFGAVILNLGKSLFLFLCAVVSVVASHLREHVASRE